MFQSTPDLINRENKAEIVKSLLLAAFQSTPDLINRENMMYNVDDDDYPSVSIHSRFN